MQTSPRPNCADIAADEADAAYVARTISAFRRGCRTTAKQAIIAAYESGSITQARAIIAGWRLSDA